MSFRLQNLCYSPLIFIRNSVFKAYALLSYIKSPTPLAPLSAGEGLGVRPLDLGRLFTPPLVQSAFHSPLHSERGRG